MIRVLSPQSKCLRSESITRVPKKRIKIDSRPFLTNYKEKRKVETPSSEFATVSNSRFREVRIRGDRSISRNLNNVFDARKFINFFSAPKAKITSNRSHNEGSSIFDFKKRTEPDWRILSPVLLEKDFGCVLKEIKYKIFNEYPTATDLVAFCADGYDVPKRFIISGGIPKQNALQIIGIYTILAFSILDKENKFEVIGRIQRVMDKHSDTLNANISLYFSRLKLYSTDKCSIEERFRQILQFTIKEPTLNNDASLFIGFILTSCGKPIKPESITINELFESVRSVSRMTGLNLKCAEISDKLTCSKLTSDSVSLGPLIVYSEIAHFIPFICTGPIDSNCKMILGSSDYSSDMKNTQETQAPKIRGASLSRLNMRKFLGRKISDVSSKIPTIFDRTKYSSFNDISSLFRSPSTSKYRSPSKEVNLSFRVLPNTASIKVPDEASIFAKESCKSMSRIASYIKQFKNLKEKLSPRISTQFEELEIDLSRLVDQMDEHSTRIRELNPR